MQPIDDYEFNKNETFFMSSFPKYPRSKERADLLLEKSIKI
ncbi:MAG: hypothetical protein ACJAXY_001131 [Nonlabens sp.]|jgi:hypothetical protein